VNHVTRIYINNLQAVSGSCFFTFKLIIQLQTLEPLIVSSSIDQRLRRHLWISASTRILDKKPQVQINPTA